MYVADLSLPLRIYISASQSVNQSIRYYQHHTLGILVSRCGICRISRVRQTQIFSPSPPDIAKHNTFTMPYDNTTVAITTALTTFVTGYVFGLYTSRGYLISPALQAERRGNYQDPVESEESDVDEDDSLLDHAPNWTNGEDADVKQGLRFSADKKAAAAAPKLKLTNEECKLVLVVRTDLGMTKGIVSFLSPAARPQGLHQPKRDLSS